MGAERRLCKPVRAHRTRGEGQLLDTVNVPYGVFQPGGIIGEFVYHCHILEHEDNGMMAKIRVVP